MSVSLSHIGIYILSYFFLLVSHLIWSAWKFRRHSIFVSNGFLGTFIFLSAALLSDEFCLNNLLGLVHVALGCLGGAISTRQLIVHDQFPLGYSAGLILSWALCICLCQWVIHWYLYPFILFSLVWYLIWYGRLDNSESTAFLFQMAFWAHSYSLAQFSYKMSSV